MARSSEGHLKVTARSNQLKTGKIAFFTILFTSDVNGQDPPKPQQGETPQEVTGGNLRVGGVLSQSNHPFKSLIDPYVKNG